MAAHFETREMTTNMYLHFVGISDDAQGLVNVGSLRRILDQDHLHPCTLLEHHAVKYCGYVHIHG